MAPISPAAALRFGVRFDPSTEKAISHYLHRWVLGGDLDTAGIVHEAEVYSREPKDLAAAFPRLPKTDDRFFFSTCKRQKADKDRMVRIVGDGSWTTQGKKADVKNEAGQKIGTCETLRFTYKRKSSKPTSHWLMEEYRCLLEEALVGETEERVFCKIYVSTRAPPGSTTHQESAAGDRRQEPAPPVPIQEPRPPVVVPVKRPAPLCRVVPRAASQSQSPRSLGQGQRRVMAPPVPATVITQPQAPKKRPAPPIAEPPCPCPKKMRPVPAVKPASAPHLPSVPCPASRQVPLPPPQGFIAPVTGPRPAPAWLRPMHPGLQSAFGPSPAQRLHQPVLASPITRPAPPPPRPAEASATAEDDDGDDLLNLIEGRMMEAQDDDVDEFAVSLEKELVDVGEEMDHDEVMRSLFEML